MNARRLAFLYSPELEGLSYPPDCPFRTERATQTRRRLMSFGLLGVPGRDTVAARRATRDEMAIAHTPSYVEELERASGGELTAAGFASGLAGPDTPVFGDLLAYGAWAAGAGMVAADLLLSGQYDIAFNLWGGLHHAMPSRASGFCYVNDVVLTCSRLAAAGKRVFCLDVDAHHGDGTQAAFYRRADVFTVSIHESGRSLFPWGGFEDEIGEGAGLGYNANLSLPAATYDAAFRLACERVAYPLLKAYRPDVIVLELGMDTLAGDPLTHLHLTNNVVVDLVEALMDTGLPLLVLGGGGYHVENTVRAWALAWRTACGEGDEDIYSLGLGGVMLGSSEWAGGLRDRELVVTEERRSVVEPDLRANIAAVERLVFPHHGLNPNPAPSSAAVSAQPNLVSD
jgi:acetoin utilization protein AcuC